MYHLICKLISKAQTSTVKHFKHACCVMHKRKVIAYGVNNHRTYRRNVGSSPSDHAESHAIHKLKNIHGTPKKRLHILVIRVSKSGKMLNSKPCKSCCELLLRNNIRHIMYSTGDGAIVYEHISSSNEHTLSKGYNWSTTIL